jgi:hypothetical protein
VLLLVIAHAHDFAPGAGQDAEPRRYRVACAIERRRGRLEHFITAREVERRILAQAGQGRRQVGRPEDPPAELDELGVDPGDLGDAGRMQIVCLEVERGVVSDQPAIGICAARDVHQARPFGRPRYREDLVGEGGAKAGEGGSDGVLDRRPEADPEAIELGRRPVGVVRLGRTSHRPCAGRSSEQVIELVDHPLDRVAGGGSAVGKRSPEVADRGVDPAGHRLPALDHRPPFGRGADRLE